MCAGGITRGGPRTYRNEKLSYPPDVCDEGAEKEPPSLLRLARYPTLGNELEGPKLAEKLSWGGS